MLFFVICEGFDDSVILVFGVVMIGNYEMYKVFMLFKNVWLKWLKEDILLCVLVLKIWVSGVFFIFLMLVLFNYL